MENTEMTQEISKPAFRLIVAGSRRFANYGAIKQLLDRLLTDKRATHRIIIVSGAAQGPDTLGRAYAIENGFPLEVYEADWDNVGRSAGYRRNEEMGRVSDALLAFWDLKSTGTRHMIDWMYKAGKSVRVAEVDTIFQCVNRMVPYPLQEEE